MTAEKARHSTNIDRHCYLWDKFQKHESKLTLIRCKRPECFFYFSLYFSFVVLYVLTLIKNVVLPIFFFIYDVKYFPNSNGLLGFHFPGHFSFSLYFTRLKRNLLGIYPSQAVHIQYENYGGGLHIPCGLKLQLCVPKLCRSKGK